MASLIGALRVTLGIDTAAFSSGLGKAENVAKARMAGITKAMIGFASGVGLAALTGLASRALEYASSLGEVAQQLGVSTKELQEYRYAASQVGIEQDAMDKALAKLTRTIGQATTGGAAQAKVFNALGISVRGANGEVRTAGEVIPEIADALKRIEDPARRAAVLTSLFGRAGQQLETLLSGGASEVNNLRNAAQRLGVVLSEDEIRNADDTADKLSALKQVLEAKIAGVVAQNASEIMQLAESLAQLADNAIKALANWSAFQRTMGKRDQMRTAVRGYLEKHPASTRSQTTNARDIAYGMIDQRLGLETVDAGGFLGAIGVKETRLKPRRKTAAATHQPGKTQPAAPLDDLELTGGGGHHASHAGADAKRAEEERKRHQQQYDEQIRSLQIDELRGREELAQGIDERAGFAKKQAKLEYEGALAQIDFQVSMKEIDGTQAEKLKAMQAINFSLNNQKIELDRQQALLEQQYGLADDRSEMEQDRLQIESDLARTAKERREVEMRILDNRLAQEREQANRTLNDPNKIDEWGAALQRRDWLDKNEGSLRAQVNKNNMSPLEAFLDKLPKNAAEANEALEEVAAGGIGSIVDGLADAATGARSLGSVFKQVARDIIADLIRIQIRRAIVSGLSSVLGGLGGVGANHGTGAGDPIGDIIKGGFTPSLPAFASGGIFRVGGRPGVDTNLLSINGTPSARVSAGEHVAVIPNNKGGGRGSVSFDLRGAVMTADLVAQMNRIGQVTGTAAAMAGSQLAEKRIYGRGRRRIPGS